MTSAGYVFQNDLNIYIQYKCVKCSNEFKPFFKNSQQFLGDFNSLLQTVNTHAVDKHKIQISKYIRNVEMKSSFFVFFYSQLKLQFLTLYVDLTKRD